MSRKRMITSLLLALGATTIATPVLAEGHGELLVGNKSAASVWRLGMAGGAKLGEAGTGQGPHEIAVVPGRRSAVVADYGTGDAPGNTLTVLDLDSDASRTISLGENTRPHGMRFLPGGRRLLATTEGSDALVVVDIDAGTVERVIDIGPGKGHMVALSADGAVAYASKVDSGHVVRVDLAAARAARDDTDPRTAVRESPAGAGAEGIDVAPDGTVWVSNREDGTVTVHDPDSLAVLDTLASPGFPIRLVFTPDGRHALVTNARAATLSVFDAATRESVASVSLEPDGVELHETMLGRAALPIGAIADPAGGRVFVAVSGADRIAVIDTASWQVTGYWETGREPDALGIVAP
ncbi:beta-propeller fold lactonase family protein [Luteimonas sp. MJ204]|uniref:beta-propeller fold lactonase family protein n=1 Tax=Luteimonas sp. MJ145 TaxID=3129234 RepID=UPI0031BBCCC5